MSFFQQKIARKFSSTHSDVMGKGEKEKEKESASSILLNLIDCFHFFLYHFCTFGDIDDATERMNNTAQSVDVVKDCFGMTEVRKNKSFANVNHPEEEKAAAATGEDGSINGEEFHW